MKAVCKKLFSLMLVAVLLISAIPFQASAAGGKMYFITSGNQLIDEKVIYSEDFTTGVYTGRMPGAVYTRERYLAAEGGSQDLEFQYWVANKDGVIVGRFDPKKDTISADVIDSYGNIVLNPVMDFAVKNITLDAKGGTVKGAATAGHPVMLGENYGTREVLPNATRNHYTFNGWFIAGPNSTEIPLTNDMKVESYANAYAKWTPNEYVVSALSYDIGAFKWKDTPITSVGVQAGKTVAQANSSFKAYVEEQAKIDGYEIEGWERVYSNGSVSAFDFNSTAVYGEVLSDGTVISNITVRPIYKGTVTLDMCQMTNLADRTHTVRIGKPIGNLYNPGSQAGGVFMRWLYSNKTSEVKSTDLFNPAYGNIYYAEWGIAAELHLNLYNEDLKLLDTFDYSVPVNKTFNMSDINLDKYVSGYDKNRITWYDRDNWIEYKGGGNPQRTEVIPAGTLKEDTTYEYYVVLYEAPGSNTSTNATQATTPTKTPSDPTNAQTGDSSMIYVTMGTMFAAAAALVVMAELRKRKKI